MRKHLFILWLIGFIIGLVAYKAIEPTHRINDDSLAYRKEELNIIKTGSIASYGEIICNLYARERLAYIIIMANKYRYPDACYNFYCSTYLSEYNQPVLKNDSIVHQCSADSTTTTFAVDFLKYGASLGSKSCADVLNKKFDL